jgi:hypothetical protein
MRKYRDPRQALLLAALGSFLAPHSPAFACSSLEPQPTDLQLFEKAREVFVARIVETKLSTVGDSECESDPSEPDLCTYVSGTYELVKALKGTPSSHGHVADAIMAIGNCSLGLLAGWYYVFYLGEGDALVLHPGGSFALGASFDKREQEFVRVLEEPEHRRPKDEG